MQKDKKRRGFFSLISPFLTFYAVTMVVQILIVMGITMTHMTEILDMASTAESEMALADTMFNLVMDQYMDHIAILTGASALFCIPIFYWMMKKDKQYEKLIGFPVWEKTKWTNYLPLVVFGVVLCIGFNNIILLGNLGQYSEAYQSANQVIYQESLLFQIIGFGIVVPIAEEMMFRGLIFKRMSYMSGIRMGMILSAIVFGVYHGNFVQGLYGLVMGCVLAWLYEKYGSLLAPMLVHIVANVTSLLATEYGLFTWIFHDIIRVMIATGLCALIGSSIFVMIRNKFRKEIDVAAQGEAVEEQSISDDENQG